MRLIRSIAEIGPPPPPYTRGGDRFNISSLQVFEAYSTLGPQSIVFTGNRIDGSTVTKNYTTSTAFARETVDFTEFNDLTEFSLYGAEAFDDLVWSESFGVMDSVPSLLEGISVEDVDGNLERTYLEVRYGKLSVDLAGGASILYGANNSGALELGGTQSQINDALATLSYQSYSGFVGTDTLIIDSVDNQGRSDTDRFTISVTPYAEVAPINTITPPSGIIDFNSLPPRSNFITNTYREDGFTVSNYGGLSSPSHFNVFNMALTDSWPSTTTVDRGGSLFNISSIQVSELDSDAPAQSFVFEGMRADGSIVTQNYTTAEAFERETVSFTDFNNLVEFSFEGVEAFDNLAWSEPTISAMEGISTSVGDISVTDVNGNLDRTVLDVEYGQIAVDLSGGATISFGANNSRFLELDGTQSQINAALATLTYQSPNGFTYEDRLTVKSIDDRGMNSIDEIAINVVPFRDTAPTNVVNLPGGTIDFSALPTIEGRFATIDSYQEDGFTINNPSGMYAPDSYPSPAGNVFDMVTHNGGRTTVTKGGNLFNISSLQVSELHSDSFTQYAMFTGKRADGRTVYQPFATSTAFERERVNFADFNNLTEFSFEGVDAFDDLVWSESLSALEDTATAIVGVSVNDAEGNLLFTEVSVENGTLAVDLSGGAILMNSDNNSEGLIIEGTQSEINAALATLSYQGQPNFNGTDTLRIVSGSQESGPLLTDFSEVSISVIAVDDAPRIEVSPVFEIPENSTSGTFVGVLFAEDIDGPNNPPYWEIVGGSGQSVFSIDAATGNIFLNSETSLDFDATSSYSLEVTVSNGESTSEVETVVVNLSDVVEPLKVIEGTAAGEIINGTNKSEIIWGLGGRDILRGRSGDDQLVGGAGNDRLIGGEGADHFNGGEGNDVAYYGNASMGITVNLANGTANGGEATGDTLESIERVFGSDFDDTLIGDDQRNVLIGLEGADIIDGGGGVDAVNYLLSNAGDTIDLSESTADGGHATGDVLSNIERVLGSNFDDTLAGDDTKNVLVGFGGDDTLDGGKGNDVLDGRAGADTMTGGIGSDTFRLRDLMDSQLTNFDVITDLKIGKDKIDTQNALSAEQISQRGAVNALTEVDIQGLFTGTVFAANEAATFTLGQHTFLAINDGQDGFTANQDGLVEITGFSGDLSALTTV